MADEEEPKEDEPKGKAVDPREPKPTKGTDYSNAQKKGGRQKVEKAEKNIKKVVSGEVKVEKRGIGKKIKDLFVAADIRSVWSYVAFDILIPAAKGMIVDGVARGADRFVYGDSRAARRSGGLGERSRITYGGIVDRGRDERRDSRTRPPSNIDRTRHPRSNRNDYIFTRREDAVDVLDEMYRVLEVCDVVSVGDFNDMVGLPSPHTDQKWGWEELRGVDIRDVRSGWVIDLPDPEPI